MTCYGAVEESITVVVVYLCCDRQPGGWRVPVLGGDDESRWWLLQALIHLQSSSTQNKKTCLQEDARTKQRLMNPFYYFIYCLLLHEMFNNSQFIIFLYVMLYSVILKAKRIPQLNAFTVCFETISYWFGIIQHIAYLTSFVTYPIKL